MLIIEGEIMAGRFLRVTCKDCGSEAIIFDRSASTVACAICGSTLAVPAGGLAELTGCTVVEVLN